MGIPDQPQRQVVSKDELVRIMNEELGKYEECKDCRLREPDSLIEPDETGCNWSLDKPGALHCSGVPTEVCAPFAYRVIAEAMSKYNIKE